MKKAFIQKLSIAMASALVMTAVAPATADAKAAMSLNKKTKTLYLNENNLTQTPSSFDFNVKNKPANYSTKYKFTWYADDESIVDVAKGGVVTALKAGKTTVKCDVTRKKDGSLYKSLEAVVTVKANAKTVTIKNAPEGAMTVGTTFDFDRTMKAADGGKATDKTEWFVSADAEGKETTDVASIDNSGVVTALKAGTFYVTAKTYQSASAKDKGYTATSVAVKVDVALSLTDVKLVKNDTIDLVFDSSVKDAIKNKTDFDIINIAANKTRFTVKDFTISEDGKTVTVQTYQNYTNDVKYSVAVAGANSEFTAKIGTINKIVIDNQTVAPYTTANAKKLAFKVFDENGVDISNQYDFNTLKIESSWAGASLVENDGTMKLFNKGDKVLVTLKYEKWNSVTGADESIKSNVAEVLCADVTAASTVKWTIANRTAANPWEKTTNFVTAKDNDMKIFVKLKDNYGNEMDATHFDSMNTDVLSVDNEGNLLAVKAGSATVKVISGDYTDYLTVIVKEEATFRNVTSDVQQYTLSNSQQLDTNDYKDVTFTLQDLYGEKYDKVEASAIVGSLVVIESEDVLSVAGLPGSTNVSQSAINAAQTESKYDVTFVNGEAKVRFTADKTTASHTAKEGTVSVRLTVKGQTRVVNLSVKKPVGAVGFRLNVSGTEFDNFHSDPAEAWKHTLTCSLYSIDGSDVLYDEVNNNINYTYEIKNSKNEVVKSGDFSGASHVFTYDINNEADKFPAGDYVIIVKNGPNAKTYNFKVTSSKKGASLTVNTAAIKQPTGEYDMNDILLAATTLRVDGNVVDATRLSNVNFKYFVQDNGTIKNNAGTIATGTITGGTLQWSWLVGTETKTATSARVVVMEVSFNYQISATAPVVSYTAALTNGQQITINQ